MELPQHQSFLSFLHIRSLEVCFCSSVSIRACKSINLCNALTGSLGAKHRLPLGMLWKFQGSQLQSKGHFIFAKMARIYLFGFVKSKDHMPIQCPCDLEY